MAGENSWESLGSKEIKAGNPKGNQSWIVTGRTYAEAEASILSPADVKSWLIRKEFDAGKDWRQEEKRATESEMVGRHHRLNGHEFEQILKEWRTGKPGMLQSMGLQRVGQNSDWTKLASFPKYRKLYEIYASSRNIKLNKMFMESIFNI